MEVLKFTLCGKTAFFKKPDINNYKYYTFGHIHKVALLGLIGAVLGYGGYQKQTLDLAFNKKAKLDTYPEFYEKLHDLKIGIVPLCEHATFQRKLQRFNNTTCFASTGSKYGQNLIVEEQWLDEPAWDIYIALDCEEAEKIKENLYNNKEIIYTPYLGTNDHLADIKNVEVIEDKDVKKVEAIDNKDVIKAVSICGLFPANVGNLCEIDDNFTPYKYEEYLPVRMDKSNNLYEYEKFTCTNIPVDVIADNCPYLYNVKDKNGKTKNVVLY